MIKPLKRQGKIPGVPLIKYQWEMVDRPGRAGLYRLVTRCILKGVAIVRSTARTASTPPGGDPREVSLPLAPTPCTFLAHPEGSK